MKLFVANRSEIARRIIFSAKKMGISTAVAYALVDADLPFVREADESLLVETDDPKAAYLDKQRVINSAKTLGATHIHPGYGFLSENADFVDLVHQAGLHFIGPSSDSMRKLGDKIGSRKFLREYGISLLPSYDGEDQSEEGLLQAAKEVGFPLLIKPSAGGGGKGMFVVSKEEDFLSSLESSKRVARSAFGDDRVFLERYIQPARHIEVQILADHQGNTICLGERECSLQRRHQKLIEESPCVVLPETLRKKIFEESRQIAQSVSYENAGTVEWVWDAADGIYFLEVNTRLQVEHPVTEMVWGMDIVEWQLRIAQGESISELKLSPKGHSIEARLCAEDPQNEFLPSGGKIFRLNLPDDLARIDFGYFEGNEVSSFFDSMLGKVIVHGETRGEAIQKLRRALEKLRLVGPKTNRGYLIQILKNEKILRANLNTKLLEQTPYRFDVLEGLKLLHSVQSVESSSISDEEDDLDFYSPWGPIKRNQVEDHWEDHGKRRYFFFDFADWSEEKKSKTLAHRASSEEEEHRSQITSPMPSKVIRLAVKEGASLKKGDLILILEAMKMEHQIKAKKDCQIKKLFVQEGQQVPPDEILVELE